MTVIAAFINQKGGCGKTTAAIHVATELAKTGRRVLLVDLDPQGHAALGLGVVPRDGAPGLSEVLAHGVLQGGGPSLAETFVNARPGLDLAPANIGLAGLDARLATTVGREERVAEHLAALPEPYDAVILDSPPNLGLLTINALVAAGEAIIPVDASPFGLQGLDRLLATISMIRERTGHEVVPRVLPSLISTRDGVARASIEALRDRRPGLVMPAQVRRSPLVPLAATGGAVVAEAFPRSGVARDFIHVVRLLEAGWGDGRRRASDSFRGLEARPGALLLSHPALRPEEILLAGDFNGWKPDDGVTLSVTRRGWRKRVRVVAGRHHYKLVIRGEWVCDPANSLVEANGLGGANSVIDVPEFVRPAIEPVPIEDHTADDEVHAS